VANCIYKHVIPLEFVAKNLLTQGALRQRGGVKDFWKGGGDIVGPKIYRILKVLLMILAYENKKLYIYKA